MKYFLLALLATYTLCATAGRYELAVNEDVDYSLMDEDDRMIGFLWKDFNIKSGETIKECEVHISTTKNAIGKWQGAWGSSTQDASAGYWAMTADISISFVGQTAIIPWDVNTTISNIIQLNYGGELKWGVWWIDCNDFTIEKVVVYTNAFSGKYDHETQGDTMKATKLKAGVYSVDYGKKIVYKTLGADKMIPLNWDWFDMIPESEAFTAIEVTISTTADKIGKWQGAFGSQTNIAPEYWLMTEDMQETFSGTVGTITWDIDSTTNKALKTAAGCQFKFGIWWVDCGTITIDNITIKTSAAS